PDFLMSLTIELLHDPAANDLRLTQLAAERSSPLDRLNILYGSGLQRLAAQRMLTEAAGGGLAAVYGFTPVDLADAAARLGSPPERLAWPPGADLTVLRRMLDSLNLDRLDPHAPGLAPALLRTLTDLREAALSPNDLPEGDIRTVFSAWREVVASVEDRSSRYEDAISQATPDAAYREALGGAPLIVSGIYDFTRIQRLLLARISEAIDVHMLLVAPDDDPRSPPLRTLEALRRETAAQVIRSAIAPAPRATERYFSSGDPTAESDEIAGRILGLGRDGIAFHRVAILHQQGAPGDERLAASLARAKIPVWRVGGQQVAAAALGHASLALCRLLLAPTTVERSVLLDWLTHRSLWERPLGIVRRPAAWDRIAVEAGLSRGLHAIRDSLQDHIELTRDDDVRDLHRIVTDLAERSRALEAAESWDHAADILLDTLDTYIEERPDSEALLGAVRSTISQLAANDAFGTAWTTQDGLTAIGRALESRVVRDPRRMVGGVNIGAATGPARGIRYDAIFAAGVAERVFPAAGRQDPLLGDDRRAAINARIPAALALQRERGDSDRHAWALMRRAAVRQFSASWSRRSSAVGGPARASALILEAASDSLPAELRYSEQALSDAGRIERLTSPGVADAASRLDPADAIDSSAFKLAMLQLPDADTRALLPELWPQAEASLHARVRRSARDFTEYDGRLDPERIEDWRPLEQSWTPAALETFVTCPYRFYLRYVIGARGEAAPERADRRSPRGLHRLVRRILSSWVREYEHFKTDRTWFEYADSASYLNAVARRILDSDAGAAELGPPAGAGASRNDVLRILDLARRREAANARDGWRPLEVHAAYDGAPVRVQGGRALKFKGMIDRIDVHAGGRSRALSLFTEPDLPDVRGFVNGSSFLSVAHLSALSQRGVAIGNAEVEHRAVDAGGAVASQVLAGESLTTRGGSAAPSDGERLRGTLAVIADQLEAANFIPNPGAPPRERPNCARCAFESTCTPDLGLRYQFKARHDPERVRDLESLRRLRI
ncbi:MAG: PD-(D/E)XK nuclease family protein, partial [Chloroflexi bacterium]|nr:PD-(D/E)XK nuclease family protein [Chloroflexota bacterium]